MFQDLDSTLSSMLNDGAMALPPIVPPLTELLGADISFITPDKDFINPNRQLPAVNLFLYEVKENRDLRDPTPIVEKSGTCFIRRQPPVRIDCSYIVTAWSDEPDEQRVATEHRLLAQALLWLTRFPSIPTNYLQGTLVNQLYPPPMFVAQFDPNKNAGEFWDALAIAPRPAFYLTVTIAMDLSLAETGTLVTTRFSGFAPARNTPLETLIHIGGRVLGPEVDVVRAAANIVNAAANQPTATLPDPAAAAQFQRGDVVLLAQGATEEQATVLSINAATVTFQANLANTFNGGTIRIGDLQLGRKEIRVTNTKGIKPGLAIRLTQVATVEEQLVQAVDQQRNVLTLAGGLANSYAMISTAPPLKVAGVIAGATVNLVDSGLSTQSAVDGRYSFLRVAAGTHSIQVLATGFQSKTQPLVVPGRAEDYEITLTPLP
jgi:hypothetical protein